MDKAAPAGRPKQPRRRRPSPRLPDATVTMPAWKRWLGALAFMAGGGACAAWGVHDTVAWIRAVHRGDGVIETENVILGLPLLGGSICALGPAFLLPPRWAVRFGRAVTWTVGAVLGAMMAGIMLVPLGGLAIDGVMGYEGYRTCTVGGRGRVTDIVWAAAGVACPAP